MDYKFYRVYRFLTGQTTTNDIVSHAEKGIMQTLAQPPQTLETTAVPRRGRRLDRLTGYGENVFRISKGIEEEKARRILQHEGSEHLILTSHDIHIEITSCGWLGKRFQEEFKLKGMNVRDRAALMLEHERFTREQTAIYADIEESHQWESYYLPVIRGDHPALTDDNRTETAIRELAAQQGYVAPPLEAAPIARRYVCNRTLRAMGLHGLVFMHHPIEIHGFNELFLVMSVQDAVVCYLEAAYRSPRKTWPANYGYVFLRPDPVPPVTT